MSMVIDELVSTETTTDELKGELKDLKSHILSSMTKVAPSVVAKSNKSQSPNRGPGLPQESTGQVPVPSAPPCSDPSPVGPGGSQSKRRRKTIPKNFTCHICGNVSYSKKQELEDHMSRDHDVGPPIQCPHCQKPFKQTKRRDEYVRTVHEKKYNYWCEGCQYGTQSKLSYEEHLGQNHPEQVAQEYKCSLCSKVCKGPISLKRHMQFRLCTMKKKFQCDVCKKFYKTTAGLNLHKETEHDNKANRPAC